MAGVEGTTSFPTDAGSRHGIGGYAADGFFYWFRATAAKLLRIAEEAAPTVAQAVVTIPTTAGGTLLKASNSTRRVLWIFNDGSTRIYVGNTGLSASTGFPIDPKCTFPWASTAACYALAVTSSCSVMYQDVYD